MSAYFYIDNPITRGFQANYTLQGEYVLDMKTINSPKFLVFFGSIKIVEKGNTLRKKIR